MTYSSYLIYSIFSIFLAKYASKLIQAYLSIQWSRLVYMLLIFLPFFTPQIGILFYGRFLSPFGIDFHTDIQFVYLFGSIVSLFWGLKSIP